MEQQDFIDLFKDMMNHIYDYAALETHPLARLVELPVDAHTSRAEYLQQTVYQAIEKLRPPGGEAPGHPEGRPYFILQRRYVDGMTPQALAVELHVSERQLRRDQSRALEALASNLWDQLFGNILQSPADKSKDSPGGVMAFPLRPEHLDLTQITRGVVETLHSYAEAEGIHLHFDHPARPIPVLTDRIILRQILFSLCNYAFSLCTDRKVRIEASSQSGMASVGIRTRVDDQWAELQANQQEDSLASARLWSQQIGAELLERYPQRKRAGYVSLRLSLPGKSQPAILVVDDQQPALRMYQRYLGQTGYKVIGISDPRQVLPLLPKVQPALILLDVMMPDVDGWEILQTLRLDEQARLIPVIVCSAWEAGEMAKSLGAADFLKKPITQKGLLAALERLDLPASDRLGG